LKCNCFNFSLGIGAAFTIPSAQAHIAIHFPTPSQKAAALGVWGASGSLGFMWVKISLSRSCTN